MAEEGRPTGLPRGRRLPTGAPREEAARVDAPRFDAAGVAARDSGRGLGSLATNLIARGDVPDRVRSARFVQALLCAMLLVLLFMLAAWVVLRERIEERVEAEEAPEADVVVELPMLGEHVRVRRPKAAVPLSPKDATLLLPPHHQFVRWRLECPGIADVRNDPISRGQTSVTIPLVPPLACRVVFVSPGSSQSIPVTAGAHLTCQLRSQLSCR